MPPFTWNIGLAMSARDHCADNGPKGLLGHDGADGSKPHERMERYGERSGGFTAENIAYSLTEGVKVVVALVVDDGVPSRGHRHNIFNKDLKQCGVSSGPFKG